MPRAPKSTAEHLRDGTYNTTRHRERNDIRLAEGRPEKPRGLSPLAEKLWDSILNGRPAEFQAGCDFAALAGCCRWFSEWHETMRAAEEATDFKEKYVKLCAASMCWKQFAATGSKFGVTPADRTKLKAVETLADIDPLAALEASEN